MNITVKRFSDRADTSLSLIYIDNEFFCFGLEDEKRAFKIKGETRIPEGRYQILKRKAISPLTKRYRANHPFFDYHLQIQDVKGRL